MITSGWEPTIVEFIDGEIEDCQYRIKELEKLKENLGAIKLTPELDKMLRRGIERLQE